MVNCQWVLQTSWNVDDIYKTLYEGEFSITCGSLRENGMKFCCFCGGKINDSNKQNIQSNNAE